MKSKIEKAAPTLQKNIPAAQGDPLRPRYHFVPPANWMNDPNGTIFHNGEYHLFYQFNPVRPKWGNLHWGHAKSKDLVHWEHLPIALAPDGFPGELHCWSGCCVIADDGTPMIFYTSMNPPSLLTRARRYSQQWMATGSPDLLTWEKYPVNPVLSENIHGNQIVQQWRDPYIWKEGDDWLMVLAGEYPGEKLGRVFLYRSADLMKWEYVGLLAKDPESRGRGWECPNYVRLGDRYVLIISPYGPVIYSVGSFDGRQHHAETWHTFDHGKNFYATNTYIDGQGHTILVGWVKAQGEGWAGCLSLPRELTLADDRLVVKPSAELQTLRVTHRHIQGPMEAAIQPVLADRIEIKVRFEVEKAESFGFKIFDDQGEILIRFDFPVRHLRVGDELARLQFVSKTGPLDVHIFVDHSVIEVFINEREAFTAAFRPVLTATQTLKIAPFISQGTGIFTMDVWNLAEAPVAGSVSVG